MGDCDTYSVLMPHKGVDFCVVNKH